MLASILIVLFSVTLLVYWLRYTCLLLVKDAKPPVGVSYSVFSFPDIGAQLRAGESGAKLQKALDRDYAVLAYLVSKAPVGVEARLLVWNYRLIRCWYGIGSVAFPAEASRAVQEMADIIAALASKLRAATADGH